jgi:hypothetical protein
MDDNYYDFLRAGRTVIDGVPILGTAHLIPFKVKAWLDLSERKAAGEAVDSRHIRKHKNDVFRLSEILSSTITVDAPTAIKADLTNFCAAMENETVDMGSLGLTLDRDEALERIRHAYCI